MRPSRTTLAVGLAVVMALASASARAADDRREVEGRALYAKGSYQEALDIFAALFAEKGDPVFLRNIGRCHQKLRRPDQAIDAFHEYLRRARVKPAEREEVEGFIREMEELKTKQKGDTEVSPRTEESRPDTPPPVAESTTPEVAPGPPRLVSPPPAPEPVSTGEPARPVTRRWWFWAAIGAVVAGAVVTAVALSAGGSDPPGCPTGFDCPR